MEKTIHTDDHKELIDANDGVLYQVFERSDRMTKSASAAIGRADIQAHMPPDGHFGVHLISMGAEEHYGFNRNGDSASEAALMKYHPTFVKHAHVFREHNNRDPRKRCGDVVHAAYNPEMHRGELIVHVSKDKAPDLYKKASAGEELSWSMSMRLPFDRCSVCDNKARSPRVYCSHLRDNLTRYMPGHRKYAYARNEDNIKFFDISEVKRRADRIAAALEYFGLEKAASAEPVITGVDWAKFAGLSGPEVRPLDAWDNWMLTKLAAAEERLSHASVADLEMMHGAAARTISKAAADLAASTDFGGVAGALAERGHILDFGSFAQIITGKSVDELRGDAGFKSASDSLPSIFGDIESAGGCCCGDAMDMIEPDTMSCSLQGTGDTIDKLLSEVGDDLSMSNDSALRRGVEISVTKAAATTIVGVADPFFESMAQAYGAYVIKAARIASNAPGVDSETMVNLIVTKNRFS